MKSVWFVDMYSVPTDVSVLSVRQIKFAKYLTQLGYEVTIVCGSKAHNSDVNLITDDSAFKKIEYQGQKFFVIKTGDYGTVSIKRVLTMLKFQYDVLKYANELPKPDVVISDFAGLFGNALLRLKRKFGAKIIFDVMDLWPETFVDMGHLKRTGLIAKILYAMEHKSYRKADGIIFSFEGGKDYIKEKGWDKESGGDVDLSKVKYINNGVDLEEIIARRNEYVLDDADLDSELFTVVYLGSIREANNVKAIVDGAEELKQRGKNNIKILIYGDGDKREALEKECVEKRLNNIVFKGRLDIKYAPNMLSRCDLNLFNFEDAPLLRFGCSPNKLFMYFSSGKPVLSTVRPNYDLVEGRECGIITDNTAKGIADGIERFADMDKAEYAKYCSNCNEIAKEFDYKVLVKNVLAPLLEEKEND